MSPPVNSQKTGIASRRVTQQHFDRFRCNIIGLFEHGGSSYNIIGWFELYNIIGYNIIGFYDIIGYNIIGFHNIIGLFEHGALALNTARMAWFQEEA